MGSIFQVGSDIHPLDQPTLDYAEDSDDDDEDDEDTLTLCDDDDLNDILLESLDPDFL